MHALPLLSALVDPYVILFRQPAFRPATGSRFGDEPNPEARQALAARQSFGPERAR